MLQKLNSRIQGWFAWIILSAIAVTFALFGVEHYIQSRSANLAKAEVNGQVITVHDFDLYYRRNQNQNEPTELTSVAEQQHKLALVEEMIKKNIAVQSALVNGFHVTKDQVIKAIQNIPQFQEDGQFSVGRYQQALNNALFTPGSFQTEVWESLVTAQQQFAFKGTEFALLSELEQFVKLYQQSRDYDYLVIPYQSFAHSIKIDDQLIKAYYHQHSQEFQKPEEVTVDYVRLSMPEIRQKINISNQQIQHYYDENKSNYITPAKWHVAHIFFAIPAKATLEQQKQIAEKANKAFDLLKKSPGEFESLVKTQSDDKISVVNAGVLPWIEAGQSQFDKALVDLTKVGEISPPVKTMDGYEIFKLLAYKPSKVKTFEEVKQDINNLLTVEKVQTEYSRALEQLSDLAYQSPDTLEPIAEALHLPIQHSEPFSRLGGQSVLTKNKNVLQVAFSPEIVSQGNNSEPIQIDTDTVVILRLSKHIPASQKSLAEVKSDITTLLIKNQAEQEAKKLGQTILNLQTNLSKDNELIEQNHLKWESVKHATRQNLHVSPDINQLAFQTGKLGTVVGDSLKNGNYVLIKLTKITDGQLQDLSKEEVTNLLQKIEESHGAVEYDLYMNTLLSKAIIKRY